MGSLPAGVFLFSAVIMRIICAYRSDSALRQIVIYRTGAVAPLALPLGELSAEQAD